MNDQLKERIKYNMEWFKAIIISILADITGTASLALNLHGKPLENVFVLFGLFIIFALMAGLIFVGHTIQSIIKKL